jgi:uncharacterized protein (DUF2132 family)
MSNQPMISDKNISTTDPLKHTLKDPLHGKTLKYIVEYLYEKYGWETLGEMVNIKCFTSNPSIASSLTFLRKTEWAKKKVESLYTWAIRQK